MSATEQRLIEGKTYDQRLFSGGLRSYFHLARFHWLRRNTEGLSGDVLELGCFNGRALDYLAFKPRAYTGIDAGVEGGIYEAIARFPEHSFKISNDPEDIEGRFDLGIALETLEHIDRGMVTRYLDRMADAVDLLLVTVPVEIGPVFGGKHIIKRFMGSHHPHTLGEFLNQTMGRSHRVPQKDHKGFDYRWLVGEIAERFDIETVEGIPLPAPAWLNFGVGIRAKRRAPAGASSRNSV